MTSYLTVPQWTMSSSDYLPSSASLPTYDHMELPQITTVELLNLWEWFHITSPTALRERWISSPVASADTEMFQHHNPNTDLLRREFRHYRQCQVTA